MRSSDVVVAPRDFLGMSGISGLWAGAMVCMLIASGGVMLGLAWWSPENRAEPIAQPDIQAIELERRLAEDVGPILEAYCVSCHSGAKSKGGVDLSAVRTIKDILASSGDLAMVREMVSTHEMPPADEEEPSSHERLIVVQWLDDALAYIPPDAKIDPGWFTIHRLNRTEYRNTLRDLLGIDPGEVDLAARLPRDDTGYGLDNIADVLSVSPLAIEQYLEASERAIDLSLGRIVEIGSKPVPVRPLRGTANGQPQRQGGFLLFSNGAVQGTHEFGATGEYEIRLSAWETKAGDEHARLSVRVDGREVGAFSISGTQAEPEEVSMRVRVRGGLRTVSGFFTNDYWVPNVADRNLAIEWITVAGPLDEETTQRPQAWREIFGPHRAIEDEAERARAILLAFASRAYRRPATADDVQALMSLYEQSRAGGEGFESAVRLALTACLVSPHFLYRAVDNPDADNVSHVHRLTGTELASRLSYFLWSSMPDEELMAAAIDGSLLEDDTLRSQVRRMLADSKSSVFCENFAGQWLHLRSLDEMAMDTSRFPEFDDELRSAMKSEATMFFADVLKHDRSVLNFIDSDMVFVNDRLAALYGIEGVEGREMRRVELGATSQRGGVLTMGAVLTVTSNPTRTSPVKRGLYVLDQILGMPPPPPPADIPPLEQAALAAAGPGLREQLAAHVANPTCAVCHNRLDPLGLAFENFDAIGRWRTHDEDRPIDASGTLPGGVRIDGAADLKRILLERDEQFIENLSGTVLMYAIGRGLEPFDRPAVRQIARQARASGDTLGAIIEAVVLSETFGSCRGREQAP